MSVLTDDPRFTPSRYVEHGISRAQSGCPCASCRWLRAELQRRHRGRSRPAESMRLEWQQWAACAESPVEWFFDDHGVYRQQPRALALCGSCPVRVVCLDHAMTHREWGIWGGTTDKEREEMRRTRGCT